MFAWYLSVTAHIFPYADLGTVCEGLTAAMCCLASVVILARTQTVGLVVAGSETQGLGRSSGLAASTQSEAPCL